MERATAERFRAPTVVAALLALGALSFGTATAQEAAPPKPAAAPAAPPARAIPAPADLEPAVDTTRNAPAAATPAPSAPAAGATPPRAASATDAATPGKAAAKGGGKKGPDRLELDTTDITGNRELPKVLYIVPWKRSDLGDLVGKPVNSLLDEVLQPLDRDVFQRQNRYYDALKPGEAAAKTGAVQGSGDKP